MNPKAILLETIPQEGLFVQLSVSSGRLSEELKGRGVSSFCADGDMEASANVTRSGPDVFVIGSFRARLKTACVRCLDEFSMEVGEEVHLDLSTEPLDFEGTPGEFELSAAELEVERLKGDELDLEDIFIEQLVLALPANPLCRPECLGLCQECGKKLVKESCDCGQKPADPRFSALAGLKLKKQS